MSDSLHADAAPPTSSGFPFDPAQYIQVLSAEIDTIGALVANADWDRRVPMSATWTLADLIRHLGVVHRWATTIVTSRQQQPHPAPPGDEVDLAAWFGEGGRRLIEVLRAADPSEPCWSFGPDQQVAFWYRRQAQETMIHRRDAQEAFGTPQPLPTRMAADGVDELVTVMMPRAAERFGEPPQLAGPVVLRATDTGDQWLLIPGGEGKTPAVTRSTSDEGGASAAAIEGTAADLLLSLWGRSEPATVLTTTGDARVAATLWAGKLTP